MGIGRDPSVRSLTAVDLFCGAGGLTEGFKQVGFEFLAALDNWKPAHETHLLNHPRAEVIRRDILEVEASALPKVDVLIGSPPCTQFSYANKGGSGDITLGMKFVLRYLRLVHDLRPRFWVMENVPRLLDSLPPRVHLRRLGLEEDGFLDIPTRVVLNAADYGAPQKRLRLFSGNFPPPTPSHGDPNSLMLLAGRAAWVPARKVFEALPDPLQSPAPASVVHDPLYPLELPEGALSDHFGAACLTADEAEANRRMKADHSWYGRMKFPDPLDRPARTVMATQLRTSRETFVLKVGGEGHPRYRVPTVRECASLQSFPITYQFVGATPEVRYKLVGNAVPPLLAGGVARAILQAEGIPVPRPLKLRRKPPVVGQSAIPVRATKASRGLSLPPDRKFRDHIPGSRAQGFRVDFDNLSEGSTGVAAAHPPRWTARLWVGSGKHLLSVDPSFEQTTAQLAKVCVSPAERARGERFVHSLIQVAGASPPSAEELQATWSGRGRGLSPDALIQKTAKVVEESFPAAFYSNRVAPVAPRFPSIDREEMPVRAVAFLFAARFAAAVVNGEYPSARAAVNAALQGLGATPRNLAFLPPTPG